jgi:hypothetical protein
VRYADLINKAQRYRLHDQHRFLALVADRGRTSISICGSLVWIGAFIIAVGAKSVLGTQCTRLAPELAASLTAEWAHSVSVATFHLLRLAIRLATAPRGFLLTGLPLRPRLIGLAIAFSFWLFEKAPIQRLPLDRRVVN